METIAGGVTQTVAQQGAEVAVDQTGNALGAFNYGADQAASMVAPGAAQATTQIADQSLNTASDAVRVMTQKELTDKAISEGAETVLNSAGETVLKETGTSVAGEVTKEVVKDASGKVIEEVGQKAGEKVVTEVGGEGAKAATKAPVAGGLWTAGVDIGLHYLSDDGDDSTYTAGEVGTDVASLALDVVTFDWIGAGMQLWDIGSQWANSSKLKKEKKAAEKKRRAKVDKAEQDYTDDFYASKVYKGSNQQAMGKKSYGQYGGFSKYI